MVNHRPANRSTPPTEIESTISNARSDATQGEGGQESIFSVVTAENESSTPALTAVVMPLVMANTGATESMVNALNDLRLKNTDDAIAGANAVNVAISASPGSTTPPTEDENYDTREPDRPSTPAPIGRSYQSNFTSFTDCETCYQGAPIGTPTQVLHFAPDASLWYTMGGFQCRVPVSTDEHYVCPRITCIADECRVCLPTRSTQFPAPYVTVTTHMVRPGLYFVLPRPEAVHPAVQPFYVDCVDPHCHLCMPDYNATKLWEHESEDEEQV